MNTPLALHSKPETDAMSSLFVVIFALSMIACGDGDRRPENPSSNPLSPSGPERVQRGQIVTVEGSSVSGAEVVIIDAERLVVLARAPVDEQGGFVASVPQRPSYWLGVSGPYMTTYVDTAFVFTGEAITVAEARSYPAGKAAQAAGILGDVNNDNQVDIEDALLVLLYTLERFSFAAPNQGNIALGDVNEDGQIDVADVLLIMTYVANPLDPTLPDGIGLDPTLPDGIGLASDRDRAVLIALYKATGGVNWKNNTNWLINNAYSLDQWYGVETDDEGRVTSLYLFDNGLTGPIPEVLGNLTNLQYLDLADNELAAIPKVLGNLTNLQHLDLADNELTGPIPKVLGNLTNLQHLDLADNELTGPIPKVLGNLTNLQHLDLRGNELTGSIPEALGQLNNLQELSLANNQLTGPIPEALGNLNNLQSLRLSWNELTGPIPEALGNLNNLQSLRLSWNELTGSIPEALGQLNNLQELSLANNQLTGPIPNALGQLNNLQYLTLIGNELTGPIPEVLAQLNNLQSLWLYSNELTGPIPEALGNLSNLQSLWLANNQLTGPIPETLAQLNNLQSLWLANNQLTGPIPEALAQLNNLQELSLANNQLTGPIPEALGNLSNLQSLGLRWNELTGCIPSALQDVSVNDLDGLGLAFCPTPEIVGLYGTLVSSFTSVFFAVLVGQTSVEGEGGGSVEIAGPEWTFQVYSPDGALIINGTLNVGLDQDPIPLTGTVALAGSQEAELVLLVLDMELTVGADGLSATGTITINGAEFDVAELSAAAAAAAEAAEAAG